MTGDMRAGIWPWCVVACLILASSAPASEFVCFVYHRFGDDRYPSTNISIEAFRGQLEFLRDEGFAVLTLGEALARFDAGALDGPTVVLTVDDGYDSFRSGGLPLLREFGFPATLFINSGSVGGRGMLGWEELKGLRAEGIEIGNHTVSHAYFVDQAADGRVRQFRHELTEAQAAFAEHLGEAPSLVSYPFGEYDMGMRDAVEDMGFAAAVAQTSGVVSRHADRFALPRYPMGGPYATVQELARKAQMRALPLTAPTSSSSLLTGENPPELTLRVLRRGVRLSGAQCFVAGRPACSLRVELAGDTATVFMQARDPLRARRTLYTLTAPTAGGSGWHWFSYLWVRPGIPE